MSQPPNKVFWVGSLPGLPASEAVERLYRWFPGDQLLTFPHGEVSRHLTWVMDLLQQTQFEIHDHAMAIEGNSKTYNALRRVTYVGKEPLHVPSGWVPAVREAVELSAAIRQLQAKVGPGVKLPSGHLGVIDPAAWAAYTYATPEEAVKRLPSYRKAVVQAMNAACRRGGFDPQLESPYALMSVLAAPKNQRQRVAEARAQEIADTILGTETNQGLEVPARIHLCYGDFGGKSWLSALGIQKMDLEPLTLLVNAIHERCGSRVLSYLLPMASGDFRPSTKKGFYSPLGDINPSARVVIGSVRPEVNANTNLKAISLATDALLCEILAISLPCGAGRLSDEMFRKVVQILQECLRRLR